MSISTTSHSRRRAAVSVVLMLLTLIFPWCSPSQGPSSQRGRPL